MPNQRKRPSKPFNLVDFVMDYESGKLDEDAVIDGFQHLVGSGLAWQLQGSYGRTARALIDAGVALVALSHAANLVVTAADAFVSKDGQEIIFGKKQVDALVEAVIEWRKVKAKKR